MEVVERSCEHCHRLFIGKAFNKKIISVRSRSLIEKFVEMEISGCYCVVCLDNICGLCSETIFKHRQVCVSDSDSDEETLLLKCHEELIYTSSDDDSIGAQDIIEQEIKRLDGHVSMTFTYQNFC